jgi:diguanylate cyclase (GGDEF)-like protein
MEHDAERRWPLDMGVCGRAYHTGEPQLVTDVAADPDYLPGGVETVAEYAVPIIFRDRILGVLNLEAARAEVFSPENLVAFRTFADQLAGAIHLTSLNQELEAANERLRDANRRLERLSSLDALTGIANRRAFDEVLETEWRRAARAGTPLSLVMADIDCFKSFNDGYGHRHGDDTLAAVAGALQECLHRAGDFVARYGGEEFVVLLPGIDGPRAAAFAETLRARVEALGIAHERSTVAPVVTVSLGVASAVPAKGVAASTLIDAADRALYRAKGEGRNRVATA